MAYHGDDDVTHPGEKARWEEFLASDHGTPGHEQSGGIKKRGTSLEAAVEKEQVAVTEKQVEAKAVSQASMGVMSALLAGFSLSLIGSVNITQTYTSEAFVICGATSLGSSMIVVLEATLEYMFVTRELRRGPDSAWSLMKRLTPYRRLSETAFTVSILLYLVTCGLMVHERFSRILPISSLISEIIIFVIFIVIIFIMIGMERTKKRHLGGNRGNISSQVSIASFF